MSSLDKTTIYYSHLEKFEIHIICFLVVENKNNLLVNIQGD